jgi:hypothetical protein
VVLTLPGTRRIPSRFVKGLLRYAVTLKEPFIEVACGSQTYL